MEIANDGLAMPFLTGTLGTGVKSFNISSGNGTGCGCVWLTQAEGYDLNGWLQPFCLISTPSSVPNFLCTFVCTLIYHQFALSSWKPWSGHGLLNHDAGVSDWYPLGFISPSGSYTYMDRAPNSKLSHSMPIFYLLSRPNKISIWSILLINRRRNKDADAYS